MKVKTSVTLSEELLKAIDKHAGSHMTRSELIETAVAAFLAAQARKARNAKDLETLNANAERLNREAADVLTYQIPL